MKNKSNHSQNETQQHQSFAIMVVEDPELSELRARYAQKPASERRAAAEWNYDECVSTSVFETVFRQLQGEENCIKYPPGFSSLAMDPDYAPALLTVGCHEHQHGRQAEGMGLLLRLVQLPSDTPDWVEIIDKAGQYLMDANDANGCSLLYEAAVKTQPNEKQFITGMGWALCRAGKQLEALPWFEKTIAISPEESSILNDYGWSLAELGRYDEAQVVLEKAKRLAPPDYHLPSNNLKQLHQLRSKQNQSRGVL